MNISDASLPLLRGFRAATGIWEVSGYLGTATIIGRKVCTCSHVIGSINFENEVVLTKWVLNDISAPWIVFTGAKIHPRFDFAELQTSEDPPQESLPLERIGDIGPLVYVVGFHDDGFKSTPEGLKNFNVAPRAFFGNVVRVFEEPNNKSLSVCELSFPTLSGFSGAPVFSVGFDRIVGMVYGNVEQKIQVHSKYELHEGRMEFSETVNRILELGLFHSIDCIERCLVDLEKK